MVVATHFLLLFVSLLVLPLSHARIHYNQEPQCQTPPLNAPINDHTSAAVEDCMMAFTQLPLPKGDDRNPKDPDILVEGTFHTHAQYGTCRFEVFDSSAMAPFVGRRELIEAIQTILYTCSNTAGRVMGKKQLTPSHPHFGLFRFVSEVRVWPVLTPPGPFVFDHPD